MRAELMVIAAERRHTRLMEAVFTVARSPAVGSMAAVVALIAEPITNEGR
jgi:hypothetical protein